MGLRSLPFFKAKKGWQFAGGGLSADGGGGGGGSLPIATTTTLGGVRIGSGINVSNDGTISATSFPIPDGYRLRLAIFNADSAQTQYWAKIGVVNGIVIMGFITGSNNGSMCTDMLVTKQNPSSKMVEGKPIVWGSLSSVTIYIYYLESEV